MTIIPKSIPDSNVGPFHDYLAILSRADGGVYTRKEAKRSYSAGAVLFYLVPIIDKQDM